LIRDARLFVGIEGGLVHGATAVNTKSVCIWSGFITMDVVCYPYNINIDTSINKHVCGYKIPCDTCISDSEKHDVRNIIKSIMWELGVLWK
jgi:ADP-heptose:LPS heptosyltransferase